MADYKHLIGKHVKVEITNPGGQNGHFGADLIAQTPEGIEVHCSVGGQMTSRFIPNDRLVDVSQMLPG